MVEQPVPQREEVRSVVPAVGEMLCQQSRAQCSVPLEVLFWRSDRSALCGEYLAIEQDGLERQP